MQKLKGRLLYMGWLNLPWKLVTDDGEIDLWPIIDKFLTSLDGKRANHEGSLDGYTLSADESSEFEFRYIPGEYVFLRRLDSFGMSNVSAYLDSFLGMVSGRLVKIEVEDGKQVRFAPDASEKVAGLYFTDGTSCELPRGAEKTLCGVGQHHNCCVFLSAGPGGFSCEKFSDSFARMILNRLARGETHAKRIGNCALLGRAERGGMAI